MAEFRPMATLDLGSRVDCEKASQADGIIRSVKPKAARRLHRLLSIAVDLSSADVEHTDLTGLCVHR